MSSIDKIKLTDTDDLYDISVSPSGTLDPSGFVSNDVDQNSAISYVDTDRITTSENHSSLFSKFTRMIRNIRYLYNKIVNMETDLENKIGEAKDASIMRCFTTNIDCGAIKKGTYISLEDPVGDVIKNILRAAPDPDKYDPIIVDTWNSSEDVDNFFTTHHSGDTWEGLKLGNRIQINDGTYNVEWEIAGFDCELNKVADDGTSYDNGQGICLIPVMPLQEYKWNETSEILNGYKNSSIHSYMNETIYSNMSTIMGSHLISRNVLLSNASNIEEGSKSYEWTSAYFTLLSIKQLTNADIDRYGNRYDTGEANYYLPLFEYEEYYNDGDPDSPFFWTRSIGKDEHYSGRAYLIDGISGIPILGDPTNVYGVKPMIYLR